MLRIGRQERHGSQWKTAKESQQIRRGPYLSGRPLTTLQDSSRSTEGIILDNEYGGSKGLQYVESLPVVGSEAARLDSWKENQGNRRLLKIILGEVRQEKTQLAVFLLLLLFWGGWRGMVDHLALSTVNVGNTYGNWSLFTAILYLPPGSCLHWDLNPWFKGSVGKKISSGKVHPT